MIRSEPLSRTALAERRGGIWDYVSPSRLSLWLKCPTAFKLRYIDGIRTPAMETYAYSTTKAGILALTRHLAKNLVAEHVLVNAIAPGPFESKMMAFALGSEEGRSMVAKGVPARRIGQPDDMAGAAIFLASNASTYLVGETIVVDGGIANVG